MENRNIFTRSITVIGTILVWLPIAAPFFFGFASLAMDGRFRFDYLMPAEFAFLAFAGGILLIWAVIRMRKRLGMIGWGAVIAAAAMVVLFILGDVIPGSFQYWLALTMLLVNALAVMAMGIGGIQLWRDQIRKNPK